MRAPPALRHLTIAGAAIFLSIALCPPSVSGSAIHSALGPVATSGNNSAVGNFSAAIDRLVGIVAAAGGGLLALVWARVAISWFSNDVTKKVQAKDRARDALVGTLLFVGAISGLVWALAQWVVSGT